MTKKGTKKKAKKPQQLRMQGKEFERQDAIPELDKLAKAYVRTRNERMELTEEEVETQDALDNGLLKHGLEEYIYEGDDGVKYRCKVSATRKVSVRKITDKKPPADE